MFVEMNAAAPRLKRKRIIHVPCLWSVLYMYANAGAPHSKTAVLLCGTAASSVVGSIVATSGRHVLAAVWELCSCVCRNSWYMYIPMLTWTLDPASITAMFSHVTVM